jgi:hypothetical protein
MKKAIAGITLTSILTAASVYSFAAKDEVSDKNLNKSIGICAGHYFMTKQYDMAQSIVDRASDQSEMRAAATKWMEVILQDDKKGTFVASDQAEEACVVDLKIKTFPN